MNLNHRVADGHSSSLTEAIHRISRPLSFVIPLAIVLLSFLAIRPYFGTSWEIGPFSSGMVPSLADFLSGVLRIDKDIILSGLTLVGYALGPLSFYIFVYVVTKRHLAAIITGVAALLPMGIFSGHPPERLVLALSGKDGAHIVGLTLILLISWLFFKYCRSGQLRFLIIGSVVEILVGLVSFFSVFVLMVFFVFITISEVLVGQGKAKLLRFLIQTGLLFGIIIVIYNISLWQMVSSEAGRTTLAVLFNLLPLLFFIVPILGTFFFLIFDRRPALQPLFLAFTFTLVFGLLHLIRSSFVDIPLLSADRYGAELGVALVFLNGVVTTWIFDTVRVGKSFQRYPILFSYRIPIALGGVGLYLLLLFAASFIPRSL